MRSLLTTLCVTTALLGTPVYAYDDQYQDQEDPRLVASEPVAGTWFFRLPGHVSYAVDYDNATIYLPGDQAMLDSETAEPEKMVPIYVGDSGITEENIERIIYLGTGRQVSITDPRMEVHKLQGEEKTAHTENINYI